MLTMTTKFGRRKERTASVATLADASREYQRQRDAADVGGQPERLRDRARPSGAGPRGRLLQREGVGPAAAERLALPDSAARGATLTPGFPWFAASAAANTPPLSGLVGFSLRHRHSAPLSPGVRSPGEADCDVTS